MWTDSWKNNSLTGTSSTVNTYSWFDGAVQASTAYKASISQPTPNTTSFAYEHVGAQALLSSASVTDGRSRTVTYKSDLSGQVYKRDEYDSLAGGDPHEVWYKFGGKEIASIGNNGTRDVNYQQSVTTRRAGPDTSNSAFRFNPDLNANSGGYISRAHVEGDASLKKINSFGQGSGAGAYTARAGESLQSIAANLYGDSALWYKLAEANGLSGSARLSEGQSLRLPAGVMKNTHNAGTLKPYDPGEAIGDTSPNNPVTPKPPKKNKCGAFGQILLVVIAVVVATVTQQHWLTVEAFKGFGAAAGFMSGAAAGAAGSIASQAVGVASGIQDKFSWNAVALAAIGGGVGATKIGAKFADKIGLTKDGFLRSAVAGAAGNAVTQGVSMAVGLQTRFSWVGVAAAGAGGAVGDWADIKLQDKFTGLGETAGNAARNLLSGSASAIASAATRSALEGSNFGDNLRAAIPDVIGSAMGRAISGRISTAISAAQAGAAPASGAPLSAEPAADSASQPSYMDLYLDDRAELNRAGLAAVDAGAADKIEDDLLRLNSVVVNGVQINKWDYQALQMGRAANETVDQLQRSAARSAAYTDAFTRRQDLRESVGRLLVTGYMEEHLEKVVVSSKQTDVQTLDRGVELISSSGGKVTFRQNGVTVTMSEQAYRDWGGAAPEGMQSLELTRRRMMSDANLAQDLKLLEYGVSVATLFVGGGAVGLRAAGSGGRAALSLTDDVARVGPRMVDDASRIGCFVAGTLILTQSGLKPIEQIRIGDMVWSRPEMGDGEPGWRRVNDFFDVGEKLIWKIAIAAQDGRSETFLATGNHPFWVEGEGWTAAEYLGVGDTVRLADGTNAVVSEAADTGTSAPVYNFEVDGWHTYHVGELGVWVHNQNCGELIFDRATKTWTSKQGLIYGADPLFGNRIKHVLAHTVPNLNKQAHSVFNVSRSKVVALVDEAWAARGVSLPNDPGAFVVPMGRVVGQGGETSIKVVVLPGTSRVITAYPF